MLADKKSSPPKTKRVAYNNLNAICAAHVAGLQYWEIKLLPTLKNPEDKLAKIIVVWDQKLAQGVDSTYCMTNKYVLFPEILQEQPLEVSL